MIKNQNLLYFTKPGDKTNNSDSQDESNLQNRQKYDKKSNKSIKNLFKKRLCLFNNNFNNYQNKPRKTKSL